MDEFVHQIVVFITAHPNLAVFVIGAVAFGESFAFVSFFFPGSAVLVAAGTLVQTGVLDPVSAASAAGIGAVLGDIFSYAIGRKFGAALPKRWPFRKHPQALERGVGFFKRYGWASVFIGRFFGPLRAFVTLVAGMFRMGVVPFLAASILSAAVWAPALLFSGYLLSLAFASNWTMQQKLIALAAAVVAVFVLAIAARRAFRVR